MSNSADSSQFKSKQFQMDSMDLDEAFVVTSLKKLNSDSAPRAVEPPPMRATDLMPREPSAKLGFEKTIDRPIADRGFEKNGVAAPKASPSSTTEPQSGFQQVKDDLNRKLAKLTDENWAKDLEIQNLRSLHAAEEAVAMRLKAENSLHLSKLHEAMDRQAELEKLVAERESELQSQNEESRRALEEAKKSHAREMESLKESNAAIRNQMTRMSTEQAELTGEVERVKHDFEKRLAQARDEKEQQRRDAERELHDFKRKRDHELQEQSRLESERNAKIRQLEIECGEKAMQIEQANQMIAALEQALEASAAEVRTAQEHAAKNAQGLNQQIAQQAEMFRGRESQLNGEIGRMRAAQAGLEQNLREANETASQLRATIESQKNQHAVDLRNLEVEAERALSELQHRLQDDFQKQFEVVLAENKKFRQMLDVRETQTEVDRNNLKQWQEQLNFLDQHLRQSKDALKKEKSEILRLAKQLMNELQQARNHPFKGHIEFAEIELAKLQSQLNNTSPLSPLRPKLEERLTQMMEQRDLQQAALSSSQRELEERIQAVVAITRSANAPL